MPASNELTPVDFDALNAEFAQPGFCEADSPELRSALERLKTSNDSLDAGHSDDGLVAMGHRRLPWLRLARSVALRLQKSRLGDLEVEARLAEFAFALPMLGHEFIETSLATARALDSIGASEDAQLFYDSIVALADSTLTETHTAQNHRALQSVMTALERLVAPTPEQQALVPAVQKRMNTRFETEYLA